MVYELWVRFCRCNASANVWISFPFCYVSFRSVSVLFGFVSFRSFWVCSASFRFVSFWQQVVYEFLVRFVVSSEVDAKQAKQYVDQSLCLQLVELFDR